MTSGTHLSDSPAQSLFTSRRARWLELIFILVSCTYLPYLSSIYVVMHGGSRPMMDINYRLVVLLFFELVSMAFVWYVLARRGERLSYVGWSPRITDLLHGIGLFLVASVLTYTTGLLYMVTYRFWHGAAPQFRDLSSLLPMKLSWFLLVFILVNSFYEEGIVRGFVMSEFGFLTGSIWIAVPVSVLLQSGYHAYQGTGNLIMASSTFLVFATYFALTRRLAPVIMAHTFVNLLAFAVHK